QRDVSLTSSRENRLTTFFGRGKHTSQTRNDPGTTSKPQQQAQRIRAPRRLRPIQEDNFISFIFFFLQSPSRRHLTSTETVIVIKRGNPNITASVIHRGPKVSHPSGSPLRGYLADHCTRTENERRQSPANAPREAAPILTPLRRRLKSDRATPRS
ncbi:unnamed protein product, partial [Ixodes persulcatus]